jgi:hypothetical protein
MAGNVHRSLLANAEEVGYFYSFRQKSLLAR